MTSSVMVNFVCLLSKTHIEQGRYALSVDVALTKTTESVMKKREAEKQVYVEHDCIAGACSPETELQLQNGRCEIQFVISGALEPTLPLEEGEYIIEYNETMSECRKFLSLKPTYVASTEGNATIKFKVSGAVKHTVNIHSVPTVRDLSRSCSSTSSFVTARGSETDWQLSTTRNTSEYSTGSQDAESELEGSIREKTVTASGSIREKTVTASGCGLPSDNVDAVPIPPRELDDMMGDMAIGRNVDSSQSDQNRTAYDLLLSNKSLITLAGSMSPSDATKLLIGLEVPNHVREQNLKDHIGDVISGDYYSFLYWRNERSSRRQMPEASNQHLYEDLLRELGDIGRNDIKATIKKTLEENKTLEKKDFKHF